MKTSIIILISFAVSISSAPQVETEIVEKLDEVPITDEFAMVLINGCFARIERSLPGEDEMDLKSTLISSLFLKKIDRECILSEFKKHNFVNQIPSAQVNVESLTNPRVKNQPLSEFVLMFFAGTCYKNLDVLLEYAFESFMTINILFKTFINEPEFKLWFADKLKCASSYAVSHNILDPKVYNFDYDISEGEKNACESFKNEARKMIDGATNGFFDVVTDNKECYKNIFTNFENYLLRYSLLVQVELTDEQKRQERTSFISDFHKYVEDFVSCAAVQLKNIQA
jgi:hypothetical protein